MVCFLESEIESGLIDPNILDHRETRGILGRQLERARTLLRRS
jgi:hypothetical protein